MYYAVRRRACRRSGTQYDPSPAIQTANVSSRRHGGGERRLRPGLVRRAQPAHRRAVPHPERPDLRRRGAAGEGPGRLPAGVRHRHQSNLAAPAVRVRFAVSGVVTKDTCSAPTACRCRSRPTRPASRPSWNMPVPGALIQPNLAILAEVDPANAVTEANESDNRSRPRARRWRWTCGPPPPSPSASCRCCRRVNGLQGNVTNANKDRLPRRRPCGCTPGRLRRRPARAATPPTRPPSMRQQQQRLDPILSESRPRGRVTANRATTTASSSRTTPAASPASGTSACRWPSGWDKLRRDGVAAHEWGHNWGRQHAPCGAPGNPDPNYPYAGGVIGVYGFDVAARPVKPPTTFTDLMGYCNNEWISDYTYKGVLDYRAHAPDVARRSRRPMQPCLLVWGRIVERRAGARARLPGRHPAQPAAQPGPVPGRGTRRRRLGRVPGGLQPRAEVADDPSGGRQFAFAVPLQPDRADGSTRSTSPCQGRATVTRRASTGRPRAAESRPRGSAAAGSASGGMPRRSRCVMVRDPVTGQVLSFARGGRSEIVTDRAALDLQLSTGVRRPARASRACRADEPVGAVAGPAAALAAACASARRHRCRRPTARRRGSTRASRSSGGPASAPARCTGDAGADRGACSSRGGVSWPTAASRPPVPPARVDSLVASSRRAAISTSPTGMSPASPAAALRDRLAVGDHRGAGAGPQQADRARPRLHGCAPGARARSKERIDSVAGVARWIRPVSRRDPAGPAPHRPAASPPPPRAPAPRPARSPPTAR